MLRRRLLLRQIYLKRLRGRYVGLAFTDLDLKWVLNHMLHKMASIWWNSAGFPRSLASPLL